MKYFFQTPSDEKNGQWIWIAIVKDDVTCEFKRKEICNEREISIQLRLIASFVSIWINSEFDSDLYLVAAIRKLFEADFLFVALWFERRLKMRHWKRDV